MAKRAAAGKTGLNITQEVRALVEANKEIKGAEVMAALREKFPKVSLNDSSCLVAYSNVRKKLGLSKTLAKRPISRRSGRPSASVAPATSSTPAVAGSLDISLLQAAKALLQHCKGDLAVAQGALKQIASLQMT